MQYYSGELPDFASELKAQLSSTLNAKQYLTLFPGAADTGPLALFGR